jgi:hypothetical protein
MSVYPNLNKTTETPLEPAVIPQLRGVTAEPILKPLPTIADLLKDSLPFSLLLRTDFADEAAWQTLCATLDEPNADDYKADVYCLSDPAYDGLTVTQLVALACQRRERNFVLIADRTTFTTPEQLVLVVDLAKTPGRTLRVVARALASVECNLFHCNMVFDDFARCVDPDGVFRGFRCVTRIDLIASGYRRAADLIHRLVADFTAAELQHRPCPRAPTAAWIMGYLTRTLQSTAEQLDAAPLLPITPELVSKLTQTNKAAGDPADRAEPAELRKRFYACLEQVIKAVQTLPTEKLADPSPPAGEYTMNLAEALLLVSLDLVLHAGELSSIRRSLGKPGVV